jgi:opacity protein-like surface antigen
MKPEFDLAFSRLVESCRDKARRRYRRGPNHAQSENRFGGTHDTVTVFAYQTIGGVRYMVLPSLAFDIDYRYFATSGTTFTLTNPDQIRSDYPTHNVVASLSWLFGVP